MRNRVGSAGCAIAVLTCLTVSAWATPTHAQLDQKLRSGALIEGELDSEGSDWSTSLRFDPDTALQIDAIPGPGSLDADLQLQLFDPDGKLLVSDDDGGDANNPRILHYSALGGDYRIAVSSWEGARARFALMARTSDVWPPERSILGVVTKKTSYDIDFAKGSDALFSISMETGKILRVRTDGCGGSQDLKLDTAIEVTRDQEVVAIDDDGGDFFCSSLILLSSNEADYLVKVSNLLGDSGTAKVWFEPVDLKAPEIFELESLSTEKTGEFNAETAIVLARSDARMLSPVALYSFPEGDEVLAVARQDGTISVTLESESFAPHLELGYDSPFGFAVIAQSNDFIGAGNARLEFAPGGGATPLTDENIDYWRRLVRIRVSGGQGAIGDYKLSVAASAPGLSEKPSLDPPPESP